jgi:antitoxin (DNA-binding transcriptional repressor) of toxin-antitoxin stability system
MDISVTGFRQRCLEIIRGVEKTGKPVTLTRRGKRSRACRLRSQPLRVSALEPWERLRATQLTGAAPEDRREAPVELLEHYEHAQARQAKQAGGACDFGWMG